MTERSGKLMLVGLLALTGFLLLLALLVSYLVPYYGFGSIHPRLPIVMAIIMGGLAFALAVILTLFSTVVLLGHDIPFSRNIRSFGVRVLLPVLTVTGKLAGLKKEDIQHAFVDFNNELVMAHCTSDSPPSTILLLMPHCLQNSECPVKVTYKVQNCKRCGKCPIKDLIGLSERYGVDLAVATGGTIARRIVIEKRPDLIIAVACERDLTSGIQDTTPLPVYGIFNERPSGPCLNTRVAIEHVESVLMRVLRQKEK